MDLLPEQDRDLVILEHISRDPEASQATLATQLGVAVGTINWHIKRLIAKGYVKVRRAERRKLLYIITPDGLSMRARLTLDYIQSSFRMYRLVRQRVLDQLVEIKKAGYSQVRLEGEGDVADVCRLTCIEHGLAIVENHDVPLLKIQDLKVLLVWNGASAAISGAE
jgi:DNA-binding MarR family transcriptional regulator